MRALVVDRITGNAAAGIMPAIPKSLEGAVGALVQLDKRIGSKRDVVVEQTAAAAAKPGVQRQVAGGAPIMIGADENPLTDEEIQKMSRALAVHRASVTDDNDENSVELPDILGGDEAKPAEE